MIKKYIVKFMIIFLVVIAVLHVINHSEKSSEFKKVIVCKHVDGDTVYVKFPNGREEKVRMIGIDTPETKHPTKGIQPYGKEASNFTKSKLLGRKVYLEKDVSDKDKYGRLLRYIWIKQPSEHPTKKEVIKKCFNATLVSEGYARVYTYPPDIKYNYIFLQLEKQARKQNKGLWKLKY